MAHADEKRCVYPVMPKSPDVGSAGWIDRGPERPTDSVYSQFGYGGYTFKQFEVKPCVMGQSMPAEDPVLLRAGMWLATVIAAVAVRAARLVFGHDGVWTVFASIFAPLTTLMPGWAFVMFSSVGVTASAIWLASINRAGRVKDVAVKSVSILLVMTAAGACMTWALVIPRAQSDMIGASLGGLQTLTTGSAGSADVAIGDAMTDNVLMPMWAYARLGPYPDAVDKYAWRLRAASTFSRTEMDDIQAAYAAGNGPGAEARLVGRKAIQQTQIADEMKATHPAARAYLDREETQGQVDGIALGVGVAMLGLLVLIVALVVIAVAKAALCAGVWLFPLAAAVLQHPRFQRSAATFGLVLWWLTLAAFGACAVFVLWMLGPMRALVGDGATSMEDRFLALVLIYGVLFVLWKFRRVVWSVKRRADKIAAGGSTSSVAALTQAGRGEAKESWLRYRAQRATTHGNSDGVEKGKSAAPDAPSRTPDPVVESETPPTRFEAALHRRAERKTRERTRVADATSDAARPSATSPDDFDEALNRRYARMEEDEIARRQPAEVVETEPPVVVSTVVK